MLTTPLLKKFLLTKPHIKEYGRGYVFRMQQLPSKSLGINSTRSSRCRTVGSTDQYSEDPDFGSHGLFFP
jgi:hypothetical protein